MSKTVFTNGCFDIGHAGHLSLLRYCRAISGEHGSVTVGLNTDGSVKRLKGNSRPIMSFSERVDWLQRTGFVDSIWPLDDDDPRNLLKKLKPNIVVKGGDYTRDKMIEWDTAESVGAEVRLLKNTIAISTSEIIRRCIEKHSTNNSRLENMSRFLSIAPPGIVIEVGVWKGGSLQFLAERHPERQFFGFDTFEGMPPECHLDNHHKQGHFGDTSFDEAQANMIGLHNVTLTKGVFPGSDITGSQPIAMVHCDVDLYSSTINTFRHLAPRIVSNGRMYCDDAFQATCEGATFAMCEFAFEAKRIPQFDLYSHPTFCF